MGGEGGEGGEGLSRTSAQGNMSGVKCEKEDKEKHPLALEADYYEVRGRIVLLLFFCLFV